jgi:lipoyl(octanoyl) transferase
MDLIWTFLGRADYGPILEAQRSIRTAVIAGRAPGGLLLLEHPPTITIGRHGEKKNVLASSEVLLREGIGVHHIERGGDVTYHGPGQLVGYPVMPVTGGVRRFVGSLGEAARQTLADLGVEASWDDHRPGLWTAHGKIAAVGLHVSRSVAMHGIAINVDPDLTHYQHIVPCGLAAGSVTSIRALAGAAPDLAEVAERFVAHFAPPGPPRPKLRLSIDEFFARQSQDRPPISEPI